MKIICSGFLASFTRKPTFVFLFTEVHAKALLKIGQLYTERIYFCGCRFFLFPYRWTPFKKGTKII